MKKTFSLAEVDTGVLDHFFQSCARGDFDGAASLAEMILDHSKNDEIKKQVRKRFTLFMSTRFSYLLDGDEELNNVHSGLLGVYLNRASKKLNISSDIPEFSEVATRYVKEGKTLLHYDRLYTLYQAILNTLEIQGDVVELGVYRGGSLKFTSEILGKHRVPKRIIGFDTFSGHPEVDESDGRAHKHGMFSTKIDAVTAYIGDENVELVAGDASVTFKEYATHSGGISLVHMDMDLHKPTTDALPIAWELLAPKGVILLDDYGFTSCPGVKMAVDDFLKTNPAMNFHLMTGQMIVVK